MIALPSELESTKGGRGDRYSGAEAAPRRLLPSRPVLQAGLFTIATVSGSLLAALGKGLLARLLDVQEFGSFSFAVSFLALTGMVMELGLFLPVARMAARSEGERRRQLMGAALLIYVPLGIAFDLAIFALSFAVDHVFRVHAGVALRTVSPVAFVYPLTFIGLVLAQGVDRLHLYSIATPLGSVLFVGVLALALALGAHVPPDAALVASAATLGIGFLPLFIGIRPTGRGARRLFGSILRQARDYGFAVYVGRVLALGTYQMDVLMLAALTNARTVGLYALAGAIANTVGIPGTGLGNALFARFSTSDRIQARWLGVTWIIGALGVVLVWLLAGQFLAAAFPRSYEMARLFVLPLAIAAGLRGATGIYNTFLSAHGRGRELRNAAYALTASNVVLNIALIPPFGGTGAAWASAAALCVNLFVHVFYYRRGGRSSGDVLRATDAASTATPSSRLALARNRRRPPEQLALPATETIIAQRGNRPGPRPGQLAYGRMPNRSAPRSWSDSRQAVHRTTQALALVAGCGALGIMMTRTGIERDFALFLVLAPAVYIGVWMLGDRALPVWVVATVTAYPFLRFPQEHPLVTFDRLFVAGAIACLLESHRKRTTSSATRFVATALAGFVLLTGLRALATRDAQLSAVATWVDSLGVPWVLFLLARRSIRDSSRRLQLGGAFTVAGAFLAALAIFERATGLELATLSGGQVFLDPAVGSRASGPFATPDVLAVTLLVCLAMTMYWVQAGRGGRWVGISIVALELVGIALTFFRGAWISAVLILIITVGIRPKRFARFIGTSTVVLAVAGAVLFESYSATPGLNQRVTNTSNVSGRLATYQQSLRVFETAPLFGVGVTRFIAVSKQLGTSNLAVVGGVSAVPYAHNSFLLVLVEQGLVGFLPLVALSIAVGLLARRLLRRSRSRTDTLFALALAGALVAYLLMSMELVEITNTTGNAMIAVLLGTAVAQLDDSRARHRSAEVGAA